MGDSPYTVFEPATTVLDTGIHLIEASAGTGKTYAITMLVLRHLVEKDIPLEQQLIVTYTKAATEELRERIRSRLLAVRDLLTDGFHRADHDPTLEQWLTGLGDRAGARARIVRALGDIDMAPVFTIHGFCQRMLAEHALESGQPFTAELLTDIEAVRQEVAADFWRRRIYFLPTFFCSLIVNRYGDPASLLTSVQAALDENCTIEPAATGVERLQTEIEDLTGWLKQWWKRYGERFVDRCRNAIDANCFKKEFTEGFAAWREQLVAFFSSDDRPPPSFLWLDADQLLTQINGNKIRGEQKKREFLAAWPLPGEPLVRLLEAMASFTLQIRSELACALRTEVGERLAASGRMGYDDLIRNLARALAVDEKGFLQQRLAERYRIGLIDEFQDTDRAQWQIFHGIFGHRQQSLYLIGDPKQAIYRFRGADIHSYFDAKNTARSWLTLNRNYRSHPTLVDAVNNLFTSRDKPFLLDQGILDYRPVTAALGTAEHDLTEENSSLAGIVYCQLQLSDRGDGRWSSTMAAGALRQFVVAEILRLLSNPPRYRSGTAIRSLAPRDIAILVRTGRQAEEFRDALSTACIPVVTSSRRSVYHSRECRELNMVLRAVLTPRDSAILRGALACRWFGLQGSDFQRFRDEEEVLGDSILRFAEYRRRWQEDGFLVMMQQLLAVEKVPIILAGGEQAQRSLANLYHLLELIQDKEMTEKLQPGELVSWLNRMMTEKTGDEASELLLESDDDAVQIVTMHGAKGLEYPVVFCPFLWYGSSRTEQQKEQVRCYEEGEQIVDLGTAAFERRRQLAVAEERAEELRLTYVALTRAKLRCYLPWVDIRPYATVASSFDTALGYLLFPAGECSHTEQAARIREMAREAGGQYLEVAAETVTGRFVQGVTGDQLASRIGAVGGMRGGFERTSFSALANLAAEELPVAQTSEDTAGGPEILVTGLPRGAHFGNVIHDLLETIPFKDLADRHVDELSITTLCRRYGLAADPDALLHLLQATVISPLPQPGGGGDGEVRFRLADIDPARCSREMAFTLHLEQCATDAINTILEDEPAVLPLAYKKIQGYLTGFIDLFFYADNRYWVLDYKTNNLGEVQRNYAPDCLLAAMRDHNYGLQYWLYTLVLHRYLRDRLPGYEYRRDFGGVFYLFMRGMRPERPGCGVFSCQPDPAKLHALDALFAGGAHDG